MTRGVDGRAVGPSMVGVAGWRWGRLGLGKAVVAVMNSAGVGMKFMEMP